VFITAVVNPLRRIGIVNAFAAQSQWSELPYPLTEIATPLPLRPLDASTFFEHMLEDATGLAGVIADAT
jgi:hypothetical protein